jgi:hypothetical protein
MTSPSVHRSVRELLLQQFPQLANHDIDALLDEAKCTPRLLPRLYEHLTSNPGLKAAPGPPPVVGRLALVLYRAGLPVDPPRCALCGRQVALWHPHIEGRICGRCYERHRQDHGTCGSCDRRVRLAHGQRPDGAVICNRCAPRQKPLCADCGAAAPVYAKTTAGTVCHRCYRRSHQPVRTCGGCGRQRVITLRATDTNPDLCTSCIPRTRSPRPKVHGDCVRCGKHAPGHMSDAGFRCNPCRKRTSPARRCAFCGQQRPAAANWPAGPACASCFNQVRMRPGICTGCGQTRVLIGLDTAGRPACGPCSGVDLDYRCPTCGDPGRTYEAGRCYRCVLDSRLTSLLAGPDGAVPHQLRPLSAALLSTEKPRSVVVWRGKSRAAQLLRNLAGLGQPLTHELLDTMPADQGLNYLRQLLVHTGVLPTRIEQLDRLTPWLDQELADRPAAHVRLIRPFAIWDRLHRARRAAASRGDFPRNAAVRFRTEIRAALDLLDELDRNCVDLARMTQCHLDRWLASGPAGRRGARPFVCWAVARGLAKAVDIPPRRPAQPSVFADQQDQAAQLEHCLADDNLPIDIRVAGALIMLYGIHVGQVITLHSDDVIREDGNLLIKLGGTRLIIPPRLARLLVQLPRSTSQPAVPAPRGARTPLFPGLVPGLPAVSSRFGQRLKDHGILARGGRNTALVSLAADLPAPILADLLGLHIATAVRWAKYAKRDWHSFVAERRET